jgi:hypothetical protein
VSGSHRYGKTGNALLVDAALAAGGGWAGWFAWNINGLKIFKTRLHTRECSLAIGVLRSTLSGGDGDTGWPTGDEELDIAIAFERFAVSWI